MEVCSQLHAPAALVPEKGLMVHIGQEAGWTSEAVWTRWRKKKNTVITPAENWSPAVQRVASSHWRIKQSTFELGPLAFSDSEFDFWNLWIGHLVEQLGRGISPSQGHCLHRTAQYSKTRTHIHASSGILTHDTSVLAVEDSTCLRPRGH
jgi:hypothetical protein